MIARHWRELTLIVSPILMLYVGGYGAALIGADRALNVSVEEFLDRAMSPGFDPATNGRDAAWWDSIDVDVTAGVVAWWVVAAVCFLLATLGSLALVRFWIGAANDHPPPPGLAWAGGLRRAPRAFGWALIYAALILAAVTVVVLLAVVTPFTLLITIPAFIVLLMWTIPVVSMAATVIVAGPSGAAPVRTAIHLVDGRWWRVTGRILVVGLVGMGLGIPISVISGPILAVSITGSVVLAALAQALQGAVSQSGTALIYVWAGGPIDPELEASPGDVEAEGDRPII